MLWGCPAEGVAINAFGTFFLGMLFSGHTWWRSPFMFWLAAVPIHMAMRRMTSYDFHAFRTLRLWAITFGFGITTLECLPTQRSKSGKGCASSV
jgi:hypothetical protein